MSRQLAPCDHDGHRFPAAHAEVFDLAPMQGGAVHEAYTVDQDGTFLAQVAHQIGGGMAALSKPVVDHIGEHAGAGFLDGPVWMFLGEEGIVRVDFDTTGNFCEDRVAGRKGEGPVGEGHHVVTPPEVEVVGAAGLHVTGGLPVRELVEVVAVDADHRLVLCVDPVRQGFAADGVGVCVKPAMVQNDENAPEIGALYRI